MQAEYNLEDEAECEKDIVDIIQSLKFLSD
ncbi:MAG: hypothetical protein S4CHLAM20_00540 [Chlamydiia bacterium]|nr:hypothetical protein [Chlamydiia bacterium]